MRQTLLQLPLDKRISTRDLVSMIDLPQFGEPHRLANEILRIAETELRDCCQREQPTIATTGFNRGRTIRPFEWFNPRSIPLSPEEIDLGKRAYNAGYEDGLSSPPVGHRFEAFLDQLKQRYMLEQQEDLEVTSCVREIIDTITRDQIIDSINQNIAWKRK